MSAYQFTATKGGEICNDNAHTPDGAKRLADIYYSYGWNISEIFNSKTGYIIEAEHLHIKEVIS